MSFDLDETTLWRLIPYLVSVVSVTTSLVASCHVVLTKRDTRAAIGWIGLIWLSPLLGTVLYVLLGINRISRKAQSLRRDQPRTALPVMGKHSAERLREVLGPGETHLESLAELIGRLTGRPLLDGIAVEPLTDGDQAFPAMIAAIDGARETIALSTYIFNDDRAGKPFIEALSRAVGRGVEVRVLIDNIGVRYSWPSVMRPLRRAGVPVATFMPSLAPGYFPYLNLRDHRKILIVDGRLGFTGGMNILEDYLHQVGPRSPKHDLHFQVRGPVVAGLMQVFADDWVFATGELLTGERWFPVIEPAGPIMARVVPDGPDEDLDKFLISLQGALACARKSVAIVTPYFLPDAALISALNVAALRGVRVDILLPRQNNLNLVQWASTALLRQLIERGCRLWYSPPPFAHTKLMIVDRAWTYLGSANWDPRSFRLNFEVNVECYSAPLAESLHQWLSERQHLAEPITLQEIDGRRLPVRLRDGVARLLSPYL